ncbi:MAG: uroporphyrinogen-III synthase [Mariprofundaceae bacterium]
MHSLYDKTILVTRAVHQYAECAKLIQTYGAIPLALPCLEIQQLPDMIHQSAKSMKPDSHLLFTSRNGVQAVADALGDHLYALTQGHKVIAIGSRTAAALHAHQIKPLQLPEIASQEGLVQLCRDLAPSSITFFRAESGRNLFIEALRPLGIHIDLVTAYRTCCPNADAAEIITALRNGHVDATLLGSSRTCDHYLQRIGDIELANRPVIAVISQHVAQHAENIGLKVQVVAEEACFPSMLTRLSQYFGRTEK